DLKSYQESAQELLEDHDSVTVLSAALKLLTNERKNTPVRISSIQPISVRNASGGRGRGGNRRGRGGSGGGRRRRGGSNRRYQGNRNRSNQNRRGGNPRRNRRDS